MNMNEQKYPLAEVIEQARRMYNSKRNNQIVGSVVLIFLLGMASFLGAFWQSQQSKTESELQIVYQLDSISKSIVELKQSAHTHPVP